MPRKPTSPFPENVLRRLRTPLLSLFSGLVFSVPAAFAASTPADVVNAIHAALINNMKHGKEYGCDGRVKHLQPVVDASFDVPLIAQTVMRKHWSELSGCAAHPARRRVPRNHRGHLRQPVQRLQR